MTFGDIMSERLVAEHYSPELLEQKILAALRSAGKNPESLSSHDLEPFDNLHLGGRESIEAISAFMELRPGMRLLDVGCGLGGPARFFAERGCEVVGLDLSHEFVGVAKKLTSLLGLTDKASFQQGSAMGMPFASGSFDGAYMIHVGMNIADKAAVFREVARVLKPGSRFSIFDILRASEGDLQFPLPWASTSETSHVETVEAYRRALEAKGFQIVHQRSRGQFALESMQKMRSQAAAGNPVRVVLHLMSGEQAPVMLKNISEEIGSRKLDPVELVAVRS